MGYLKQILLKQKLEKELELVNETSESWFDGIDFSILDAQDDEPRDDELYSDDDAA